jgi:histidine triad (HIT) family protein
MDDCIFCKIIRQEIPADIVYEDDSVLAFLDIRPVSRGHTLLIPKRHFPNLLETEDAVLADMMKKTKRVAEGIMKATGAAGFNLGVNTNPAAGQIVFHTHFHIIPRYAGDGLKSWPHRDSEPKTRAGIAEEIKKFL